MKTTITCSICKKECEEVWEFGHWEKFQKYWGKEYCEECFNILMEKLKRKNNEDNKRGQGG